MADEASPFQKQQEKIVMGRPVVVGSGAAPAVPAAAIGSSETSSSNGRSSSSSSSSRVRTALLAVRALQVILAAVISALAGMALAAGVWIRSEANNPESPLHDLVGANSGGVNAQVAMQEAAMLIVAAAAALLVISILTFALSMAWLVLTCAPSRRGSGRVSRYGCDMGWDITLAVVWTALFVMQVLAVMRSNTAAPVMSVALYAAQAVLFVASAALSARMRRRVLLRSTAGGASGRRSFIAA